MVEPPRLAAQNHHPVRFEPQGGLESQIEVGSILVGGVALDGGRGGFQALVADRIQVPHHQIHVVTPG